MTRPTFRHSPPDSEFDEVIVKSMVTHLRKHENGKHVEIHLVGGNILISEDSLNTLQARLDSKDC